MKKSSSVTESMTPISSSRGQTARSAHPGERPAPGEHAPSTMPAVAKRSTSSALSGAVAQSTSTPMSPMIMNEPATSR